MHNTTKIIIGERDGWNNSSVFGITAEDQRHHTYVIGKTGSGKSTLLQNLIIQHIKLGHGVGVIDPHGDLAEELLSKIPPHRTDDLMYFNPSDLEFPTAINLLANVPKDERHLVTGGIVSSFKSIWRDSWGPRLEYILYNAILALLDCQNTSLLGANPLLTNEKYRSWVVRQVKDPFIRSFWAQEYSSYEPRFQREAIAPIQNKLGQFLFNPVIRNILGQVRSKVSFRFLMDKERLFIANLSKGKIGHEKANLIGSLLATQFQISAMGRAQIPESDRKDFFLFIDEFQNFSTDSFAQILAEARKYRLCLTLSHQYIDQLSLPVRQAVFGNVGTIICLRVGSSDADVIAKEFGNTFVASAFSDLNPFQAVIRLLEFGTNASPFLGKLFPPVSESFDNRDRLVFRSRERFASPRHLVEDRIQRWWQGVNR